MLLLDTRDKRPVHFVGIAGAGMSPLAELLARRGVLVTGCDQSGARSEDLTKLGISVHAGHDAGHVGGARALVVTSALPKDHAEVVEARRLGIPVIRRAEALGEAVSGGRLIAIAGTHGKTTTTAMTTEALSAAGLAPTGLVGGRIPAWQGNLRFGSDALFVVEADEYDRSFLALKPTIAVATNIEADHLDIYDSLEDIHATFAEFAAGAETLVVCEDDAGAAALGASFRGRVLRYGIASERADVRAVGFGSAGDTQEFTLEVNGAERGRVSLAVPGRHNVLNALAALSSGIALGVPVERMAAGLAGFNGVERRFQRLGTFAGVAVVDDYAHHPTEIRATIDAARAAFPGKRLVAAFQPHLFTRTRDFATEFGAALAGADALYLTEIYPARERPIPGVTSDLIAAAARTAGGSVTWQGGVGDVAHALSDAIRPGDVVLFLGAGDITRAGPELISRLTGRA